MAPSAMLSSFPSWTSVSSLLTCVQLNLAVITAQFSYTKRRHAIRRLDSMSDGQIERRSKQVKRANLCLAGQFRQQNNYWRLRMARKFLHQPKIALHIIADELRVNPNRCGRFVPTITQKPYNVFWALHKHDSLITLISSKKKVITVEMIHVF